jgi:hypothetical protein
LITIGLFVLRGDPPDYVREGLVTWDGERVIADPMSSPIVAKLMTQGYEISEGEGYRPQDGQAFVENLPKMFRGTLMYAAFLDDISKGNKNRKPAGSPGSTGGQYASLPSIKVTVVKERAWKGEPARVRVKPSKHAVGILGEQVLVSYMRQHGYPDAETLNLGRNNFPLDIIYDHEVVEVKTGLASNGPTAQHWRQTIGEPGESEKAWLARARPDAKRRWNERKQRAIHERKVAAVRALERKAGRSLRVKTITFIIHPDRKLADMYVFHGLHDRIMWESPEARSAYVRTLKYH